ncbi:hypothetical protein SAMN05421636_102246 [Pricia antarctica]|uniref:Uncharacterized protein n=1 Tax=Pricia antarctica TaxID=641691 RepID=A0A1G6YG84_9FLAO|nr:hypothetical protein SAMN05421636_102246 [Pricia antarctica]
MKETFHIVLQSYKIYKAKFLFNKFLEMKQWNYYEGKALSSSSNGS